MKILISFNVSCYDEGNLGNGDSHTRNFEFKGTFEEAKAFLDEVMKKRIEVQTQETELPF